MFCKHIACESTLSGGCVEAAAFASNQTLHLLPDVLYTDNDLYLGWDLQYSFLSEEVVHLSVNTRDQENIGIRRCGR